jgi:hypothetical protein
MKKIKAGLQVGLAFVVAGVVSVALASVWIVWGWVALSVLMLVAIGAGVAMWAMFRRKKEVK